MNRIVHMPHVKMGLLWSNEWFFKNEGPFTRLAKLAVVNGLTSRRINNMLFNLDDSGWKIGVVHGRSLLDTLWMLRYRDPNQMHFAIASLHASSLRSYCDCHCVEIASDSHFRYCATCLAQGFQASICQIDGIPRCPVHGDELSERCPSCGAGSPRYAIDSASFELPMRCISCGAYYSSAWSLNGMVSSWKGVKGGKQLQAVQDWLHEVSKRRAPRTDDYAFSAMSEREQRLHVFDFLRRVVPLALPGLRPIGMMINVGTAELEPFRWDFWNALQAERVALYKSLRRHFSRVFGIKKLLLRRELIQDLEYGYDKPVYSKRGMTPPTLHGFILWRSRFERSFAPHHFPSHSREKFVMEQKMLTWPDRNMKVDAATWANFALFCLRRDIANAHDWARRTASIGSLGTEEAWHRLLELLSQAAPDLYPWNGNYPRSLGLVQAGSNIELFCILDREGGEAELPT